MSPAHFGKFVAYYRVSTDKQGKSGLGLEAQQTAVKRWLDGGTWKLLASFTEVESGKRVQRPELAKALAYCKRHKATLLIARLDRLARNVHFISGLMEAKVKFVAVDMPEATPFMLHIYAAVAQEEARAISARTKAALAAAKARGKRLGSYGADVLATLEGGSATACRRVSADEGAHAARHGLRADPAQDRDTPRWPLACRDGQKVARAAVGLR